MFDRTIRMLEKCKDDARAFAYYSTLITQGFFILYYIGALTLSLGHPIIYSILLALTAAAFSFFVCTENPKIAPHAKLNRWVRISIRYAKYCVHLTAICLTFHSFYTAPQTVSPVPLTLFILAVLAFLIQMIGEVIGFLSRRYFEELLAAALADTELLRSVLDMVQSGANTIHRMKDGLSSFSERAAEKTEKWGAGLKEKFSVFRKKKGDVPLLSDVVIEEKSEKDTQSSDSLS